MFRNEGVHLNIFQQQILKLHAGWMSGQEMERMINYDELSDLIGHQLTNPND